MFETTIAVYADKVDEIVKKLDRLVKKATRYGTTLSYTVGEEYPKEVKIKSLDDGQVFGKTTETIVVPAVDVSVTYDGNVKMEGWSVLGKIETLPNTDLRMATPFGDVFREEWTHSDMHCDHCHTAHRRGTVYVVSGPDGEERQVGKACLKDYTGINPSSIVYWAEVTDLLVDIDDMKLTSEEWHDMVPADHRYISLEQVIGLAVKSISAHGYVKSTERGSTKGHVFQMLDNDIHVEDEAIRQKALDIIQWAATDEGQKELSFMELSFAPILKSGYCKQNHIGYLCYWPVAYQRYLDRIEEQRRRAEQDACSDYVGEIGKRITINVSDYRIITFWDTDFGTTVIWKITDTDGNVFTWKTTRYMDKVSTLTGTVKAHTEYRGTRQTELTRCKTA